METILLFAARGDRFFFRVCCWTRQTTRVVRVDDSRSHKSSHVCVCFLCKIIIKRSKVVESG